MIIYEKKYDKMGYLKILKIGDKQFSEYWESLGDNTFKLTNNSILNQIENGKDDKLKLYDAMIYEIVYSKDDEIPDLVEELEKALKEDKANDNKIQI
jgi:hypothetical protein